MTDKKLVKCSRWLEILLLLAAVAAIPYGVVLVSRICSRENAYGWSLWTRYGRQLWNTMAGIGIAVALAVFLRLLRREVQLPAGRPEEETK